MRNLNASALKFLPVAIILFSISILWISWPVFSQTQAPHVTNFHADDVTHGSVTLGWDVPAAPTGWTLHSYRIYRSLSATSRGDLVANLSHDSASTSTTASYTDATVEPDTLYTYKIQAVYAGDGTTYLSLYNDLTVTTPPPIPVLTVERALNSDRDRVQLKFSWTDMPGLTPDRHKPIYRRVLGSEEEYNSCCLSYTGTNPAFLPESSFPFLVSDVPYEVAIGFVRDGDTTLETVLSTSAIVYPAAPPETPANLQADSQHGVLSSVIEVSWDDPNDQTIIGYQITQIDEDDSEIVLVENTQSASTSFTDNFTIPNRDVKYGVRAISPLGMSDQAISPTGRRDSSHMLPRPRSGTSYGYHNFAGHPPYMVVTWKPQLLPDMVGPHALTGYRIMRQEGDGADPFTEAHVIVADTGSTATEYRDYDIEMDELYTYRIAAINANGVGTYMSPIYGGIVQSSTIPWPAPQAPGDLAVEKTYGFNEDASATLTWSAPEPHSWSDYYRYPEDSGITEYRILRRPIDDTGPYQLHATTTATTTHVISEGTRSDFHEYVVRAVNLAGESADSNSVSLWFPAWPAASLVGVPINPTPAGFLGETYIDIEWDPGFDKFDFSTPFAEESGTLGFPSDGGITGYQILRRVHGSGDDYGILVADTGSASASYRDASGIEGVRYQYRVAAINPAGVGLPSNSASVTLDSWPAPQGPGDLAVEQVSDTLSARLTWSAPEPHSQSDYAGYPADSGITGYQIMRRVAGSGMPYEFQAATSGAGVSYDQTLSESDNGFEYEYVVHARNPSGVGDASAAASFRLTLLPPEAPRGLEEAVMLVWAASDGMSLSYQILRRVKDSGADYSILVNDTNSTDNFYVDNDAAYGVTYQYVVKAINEFGISPASNPITGRRMGAPAPDAPRNLRGETSNGSVILSWDSPNDSSVTGYRILRRALETEISLTTLVADTGSTSATYTDASAVAGVKYAYRVVAISPAGESRESNFVNVTVALPAPPDTPDKPQNLSGSVSGGKIVLTWDDPGDSTITGYQIRRRTLDVIGPDGSFAVIEANTNSASTSYTDSNVETGVIYSYRIHAINAGGTGKASQSTTVGR